jgi:hypothetical protein
MPTLKISYSPFDSYFRGSCPLLSRETFSGSTYAPLGRRALQGLAPSIVTSTNLSGLLLKCRFPQPRSAHARELGVKFTAAKIVDNRYRWGSCTVNDNVSFNWRLIKAPMFVIDYVIVHELAHIIEANHTSRFWTIIRAHTPTMEKAKAWLKEHGHVLEQEV